MSGQIVLPPKVYLDTNHLICIARLRKGNVAGVASQYRAAYEWINALLRDRLGLIFNFFATLEWLDRNATLESAGEIAAVVDSAGVRYLVENDRFIFTREVLEECTRHDSTVRVPSIPLLPQFIRGGSYSSAYPILAQVPGYFPQAEKHHIDILTSQPRCVPVLPVDHFARLVSEMKAEHPERHANRARGFVTNLRKEIRLASENPGLFHRIRTDGELRAKWIKRALRIDRILEHWNPGIAADDILPSVDIDRCPALSLWIDVRVRRARSRQEPKSNEPDDWRILPIIPYADCAAVDRGFRHFVVQTDASLRSKVTANPNDVAATLRKWVT